MAGQKRLAIGGFEKQLHSKRAVSRLRAGPGTFVSLSLGPARGVWLHKEV